MICFVVTTILSYVLIFIALLTVIKNINFEYIFWLPQHYWTRSATGHDGLSFLIL